MAFRLKHWLAVVVLAFALIAVWRLPLDYASPNRVRARSAAELRYDSLTLALLQTRAALDQVRRARTLPAEALAVETDRVSVLVPERAGLDPDAVAALDARVHALVSALRTRDPRMVVGYAYAPDSDQAAGFSVREVSRFEVYSGVEGGTPYCLYARVARLGVLRDLVRRDVELSQPGTLLGPCVQYAKHGFPGPRIREWLERGGVGMASAERLGPRPPVPPAWQRSYMARLASAIQPLEGSAYFVRGDAMQPERCLAGDAEMCASLFLRPDRVDRIGASDRAAAARSPAVWAGRPHVWPFPADNEYLLSDLERQFGTEAFHRFWTSDRDVRPAFESAFGVDLGEWLLEWLDEGPGIEPATPAPTLSATFGSLLLISLMTGVATLWQKRRHVT